MKLKKTKKITKFMVRVRAKMSLVALVTLTLSLFPSPTGALTMEDILLGQNNPQGQVLASVTVTDSFNRADGFLGANWANNGNIAVIGNTLGDNGVSDAYANYSASMFGNDQYSQATVITTTNQDNNALAVRMVSGAKTFYFCDAGQVHAIGKFISGTLTQLKAISVTINTGDVLRCEVSGSTVTYKVNGVTINSVTDTSLTSGSPGFFVSTSDGRFDDWSGGDISAGPPDTTAPSTPNGLNTTASSQSQINLSWSASSDNTAVTGYTIYRAGLPVGTSASTSYNDTGLTSATNYSYTVDAFDAAGNHSSQSTSANATTQSPPPPDTTAPSTPTNLSASAISSAAINLSWTASTDNVGVTGYKIFRSGSQIGTSATTNYSDSGLTPSTLYSYTVFANDAAGNNSMQSTSAGATTQAAAPPGTVIDPARRADWTQAGVTGGIPNRTTVCATFNPGATATQINAAIQSCPSNGVVFLNAGTYNLAEGITFAGKSNVTLRGAGADQTKLMFADNVGCLGAYSLVCISSTNLSYYSLGPPTNAVNWTSGYAQNSTQITLSGTPGLSVGMYIVIDQLNDATDTGNVLICAGPPCTDEGGGGNGRTNRGNRQMTLVTAINGNTVTISPGVYMPNFRASQSPQAWWGNASGLVGWDGLENLSLDGTAVAGGSANVVMIMSHDSWVKGVRSINAPSPRSHIEMYQSAHDTVRDSYVVGTHDDLGHSTNYGIEMFGTANILVENNIGQHRTPLIIANGDVGSVYGYNFAINDHYNISNAQPQDSSFMQLSNYSHEIGTGMNLHEGNSGIGIDGDIVHGTSNLVTAFRNYMIGWETNKDSNTNPVHIYASNRYYNFVGNVFGKSGYHTLYQGNGNKSIWNIGDAYNSVPFDPLTVSTMLRWGNYDTVSGIARFVASEVPSSLTVLPNPQPSSQTIPASLYLSAKPAWWPSSTPWPAIGPDVSGGNVSNVSGSNDVGGHAYKVPAQSCWENAVPDPAYASDPASQPYPVKIFTPSTCYTSSGGGGGGDTTAPSAPTGLSATAISSSAITLSWTASTDNVGVTGYKIFRNGSQVGTSVSTSYGDTGLTANTSYSYTVSANDAAGNNSSQSQSSSATTFSGIPVPGDFNSDHIVNSLDYSLLNTNWFKSAGVSAYDLVVDNLINSLDFAVLKSNWGKVW